MRLFFGSLFSICFEIFFQPKLRESYVDSFYFILGEDVDW